MAFIGVLVAEEISTLEYYLSRSQLVVVGTATKVSGGFSSSETIFAATIRIEKVLYGDCDEKSLPVSIVRTTTGQLGGAKNGEKYILFLNRRPQETLRWKTVDPWFGIQQHDLAMEFGIIRAAADMKEKARWRPFRQSVDAPPSEQFARLNKLAQGDDVEIALAAMMHITNDAAHPEPIASPEELADFLSQLMKSDERQVALQAAILTCYSGDWSGFETLLATLSDQDPILRKKAATQLGDASQFVRHKDRIKEQLLKRLATETDAGALGHIVDTLGSYPSKQVLDGLIPFAKHDSEIVRQRAVIALQRIRRHYARKAAHREFATPAGEN